MATSSFATPTDKWDQYAAAPVAPPAASADKWDQYATPTAPAPAPSALSRFASSYADTTGIPQAIDAAKNAPQPSGAWDAVKQGVSDAFTNSPPAIAVRLGKAIYQQGATQLGKAKDVLTKGDYPNQPMLPRLSEAAGYAASALPIVGPMAAKAGEQIGAGDYAGGAGTAAGAITQVLFPDIVKGAANGAKAVARGAGNVSAEVLGKTTGAGATAIREAATNPTPELLEQMRSPDETAVLDNLKSAVQGVRDARASQYQQDLQSLSSPSQPPINPAPIRQARDAALQKFRVNVAPNGELDFSSSPIGNRGQADIQEANDLVTNWNDWSPAGADALKRRMDDLFSESGQARALITNLRGATKNAIVSQVPQYAKMTGDYAKASQFLDQLSDLSLDSQNPGTAVRKITTALNQNNEYRRTLIEALDQYSGTNLKGDIAGLALSKPYSRGIMGSLGTGAGLLAAVATGHVSPAIAAGMALTSPRLVGELAVAMGKARSLLPSAAPASAIRTAQAIPLVTNDPDRKQTKMPAPGQW